MILELLPLEINSAKLQKSSKIKSWIPENCPYRLCQTYTHHISSINQCIFLFVFDHFHFNSKNQLIFTVTMRYMFCPISHQNVEIYSDHFFKINMIKTMRTIKTVHLFHVKETLVDTNQVNQHLVFFTSEVFFTGTIKCIFDSLG